MIDRLKLDNEKINKIISSVEKIIRFKSKIDKWGSVYAFFCCLPFIGDPLAIS